MKNKQMLNSCNLSTLLLAAYLAITTLAVTIVEALFGHNMERHWGIILVCCAWPIALVCAIIALIVKIVKYPFDLIFKRK